MDNVHELIIKRWSPVAFDPRPVDRKQIQLLFEAAKWAPSGNNQQPWRFIFATRDMPQYSIMLELLDRDNQEWACTAPLLLLGLAQVISTYKNRPNRLAFYETGMAVSNLLLQATSMGLMVHQMGGYDVKGTREVLQIMVHQMGGYDVKGTREVLQIPDRYEPAAMMAIGYKGDRTQLPEKVAAREDKVRTRMDTQLLFQLEE